MEQIDERKEIDWLKTAKRKAAEIAEERKEVQEKKEQHQRLLYELESKLMVFNNVAVQIGYPDPIPMKLTIHRKPSEMIFIQAQYNSENLWTRKVWMKEVKPDLIWNYYYGEHTNHPAFITDSVNRLMEAITDELATIMVI